MVKIKSSAEISQAWAEAIPGVAPKYQKGIQGTNDWKQKAVAGQGLYVQRMQDQAVLARREAGLARVDDQTWKTAAAGKGARNIGAGMDAAKDKRARNYEPFRSAIEAVVLPDRTADGMQNLINRAGPIVQALEQKKKSM
jgi:hypothetical protein